MNKLTQDWTIANTDTDLQPLFDGSRACLSIPPVHVKSLLEEAQLDPLVSNERCAELFAEISRKYLNSELPGQDSWETWKSMITQIGKIGGIK